MQPQIPNCIWEFYHGAVVSLVALPMEAAWRKVEASVVAETEALSRSTALVQEDSATPLHAQPGGSTAVSAAASSPSRPPLVWVREHICLGADAGAPPSELPFAIPQPFVLVEDVVAPTAVVVPPHTPSST